MAVPLLRTLILYLAVVIAVRAMGKRQIGELDPSELVVTILVSDLGRFPCRISVSPCSPDWFQSPRWSRSKS